MIVRFKVISDFPGNTHYKINSILTDDHVNAVRNENGKPVFACDFHLFPYIFKQLNWWEELSADEIPEYVKDVTATPVRYIKTEIWQYSKEEGFFYFVNGRKYFVNMWALQPLSEGEIPD